MISFVVQMLLLSLGEGEESALSEILTLLQTDREKRYLSTNELWQNFSFNFISYCLALLIARLIC